MNKKKSELGQKNSETNQKFPETGQLVYQETDQNHMDGTNTISLQCKNILNWYIVFFEISCSRDVSMMSKKIIRVILPLFPNFLTITEFFLFGAVNTDGQLTKLPFM